MQLQLSPARGLFLGRTRTAAFPQLHHLGRMVGSSLRGRVFSVLSGGETTPAELLLVAKQAAEEAAKIILEAVDKPRVITFKGATDLVTETDKQSEAVILRVISKAFPGHAVLGEEGGISGDTSSDYLWCCDPLDGTTNFTRGYPSFAVSVGVLHRSVPVAAVVVEFAGGVGSWVARTYTATKGGGAYLNGKQIHVSSTDRLERSLLVTGFGYEHDEAWAANMELFRLFTDETAGVRRLGAAAVDLCHVALGVVDGYWEFRCPKNEVGSRLKPWDVCAGVLMVEEAGGRVTTMDGAPYSVFDRSLLASNVNLQSKVLEKTAAATEGLRNGGTNLARWFVPEGYIIQS